MNLAELFTCCRNIDPVAIFYVYIDKKNYWDCHHPIYEETFENLPIYCKTKIQHFFIDSVGNVHILIDRSEAQCE